MARKHRLITSFRLIFILLGITILSVSAVAAQESGPIVIISQIDDANFPVVKARVTAIDQSGLAIENLDPADILVWENNQAARNISVAPVSPDQTDPISLVLALDISGSMNETDENGVLKIEAAQAEAKSLLDSLGPNDQVAIISFGDEVVIEQPFTTERTALYAAVDRLQADDNYTALYNALFEAADLVADLPPGRKGIILLTDGRHTPEDTAGKEERFALDQAVRSGVPVYPVGFFTGEIGPEERDLAEDALNRMAKVTNGYYFAAPDAAELGTAFQTLASRLRLQYDLSFESTLVADCQEHELVVRINYQGQDGDDADKFNACPADAAEVTLAGPSPGTNISKQVSFIPQIVPPFELKMAEFLVDGTLMATATSLPFTFDWDTTELAPGEHTLTVLATDSAGKVHTIEETFTVEPPLSMKIITPQAGEELSEYVEVEAEVSGPGETAKVEFFWNGELQGTVERPPFTLPLTLTDFLEGEYVLLVRAHEIDGYQTEDTVQVNVVKKAGNWGLGIALALVILVLALIIPLGMRARRNRVKDAPLAAPVPDIGSVPPSTTYPAWLEVVQGPSAGQRYALVNPETTLGRSRADNDIHTPGRMASRRQATIRVSAGQYTYYDYSPTNPTIINGQEIAGSHELYEGDQIEIGDMIFKFTFEE